MNSDFFKKFLSMDELVIFKNIDNMYVIGLGLIIIRFLIELVSSMFKGSFFIPFISEMIMSVFLAFVWRAFCEILYCVAPNNRNINNNKQ